MNDLSQESLANKLYTAFQYFSSVDSSNDIAQAWLRDGADEMSAVIADEQVKGRGRRGRFWHTPPNLALAVSVIIKPKASFAARSSMVGALAVYDLADVLGIKNLGIKWPNDVQIAGKKVSGILPEAVWDGDKLLGVVLGMGVNVRLKFDDELASTAINLEDAVGKSLNRSELIFTLLERVYFWVQKIESDELFTTWKKRLSTLGQEVIVEGITERIVGQAVDVDENGALLIKTADAKILPVLAADVSLRPLVKGEADGN